MLTTLLPIDGGSATVAGLDVRRRPGGPGASVTSAARRAGRLATGRENLALQGEVLPASAVRMSPGGSGRCWSGSTWPGSRIAGSGPTPAASAAASTWHSASCTSPKVLFLDEPSTGLDPQNRASLWDHVRGLRDRGTTVFLTTHYLDEADALCDRIMIIDHGTVVAEGTPRALKQCDLPSSSATRDADACSPGRRRAGPAF